MVLEDLKPRSHLINGGGGGIIGSALSQCGFQRPRTTKGHASLNPKPNGRTFSPLQRHHGCESFSMALPPGMIACGAMSPQEITPVSWRWPHIGEIAQDLEFSVFIFRARIEGKWVKDGLWYPFSCLRARAVDSLINVGLSDFGKDLKKCVVRRDTSLDA